MLFVGVRADENAALSRVHSIGWQKNTCYLALLYSNFAFSHLAENCIGQKGEHQWKQNSNYCMMLILSTSISVRAAWFIILLQY